MWQFGRRAPGSSRSGPARGGGWEISRCRAPLHRSTTQAPRHAADVELYSSTALSSSTGLQRSTLYILYTLPLSDRLDTGADWRRKKNSLGFRVELNRRIAVKTKVGGCPRLRPCRRCNFVLYERGIPGQGSSLMTRSKDPRLAPVPLWTGIQAPARHSQLSTAPQRIQRTSQRPWNCDSPLPLILCELCVLKCPQHNSTDCPAKFLFAGAGWIGSGRIGAGLLGSGSCGAGDGF